MKEELTELFKLDSPGLAAAGWKHWFEAGKESEIPALKRFAELKECRLDGLVSHAVFPISTAKLEGFNNKIKVAKRIGYGYRDDDYFFLLICTLLFHRNPPETITLFSNPADISQDYCIRFHSHQRRNE